MDSARTTIGGDDNRPIKDMTPEERRTYNRIVKQRSRAAAAARAKNGKLPKTKEAFQALLALATASIVQNHPRVLEPLVDEIAKLLDVHASADFTAELLYKCQRIVSRDR